MRMEISDTPQKTADTPLDEPPCIDDICQGDHVRGKRPLRSDRAYSHSVNLNGLTATDQLKDADTPRGVSAQN
jgi:hypothetical protein